MKILLIKPRWPYPVGKHDLIYNRIWPPLSLANCAALLERDGHDVSLLDAHLLRISPSQLAERVKGFDKVFITSSTLDRWECPNLDLTPFMASIEKIREVTEDFFVLGYHGTVEPEEILQLTQAKAVIRGAPEMIVREICRTDDLLTINGITYKKKGFIKNNPDGNVFELNSLPIPAFHLLDLDKYSYELLGKKFVLLETARGWPHTCSFCLKQMYNKPMRHKSLGKISAELDEVVLNHGARFGYFIDLDFSADLSLVVDLCSYLERKRYPFQWTCQMRVDYVDKYLLEKMASAGCRLIHFGIEGSAKEASKNFRKNMSSQQIKQVFECCKDLGIDTAASFIFSYKDAALREVRKTVDSARFLNPSYASFHVVYPYKGTELFLRSDDDVQSRFSDFFNRNWFEKEHRRIIRDAYIQFYIRPNFLFSKLRRKTFNSYLKQVNLFSKLVQI